MAQNELKKQLKLIELIDALAKFDDAAIAALRKAAISTALIGKAATPPKSSAPKGWTNQAAFEQYRVTITADLKQTPWELPPELRLCFLDTTFTMWGNRYRRRTDNIKATCVDSLSREALVARNIAHDVANKTVPMWDAKTREWIDRAYTHAFYDVKSVQQPHGYGPSLRRLWVEPNNLAKPMKKLALALSNGRVMSRPPGR